LFLELTDLNSAIIDRVCNQGTLKAAFNVEMNPATSTSIERSEKLSNSAWPRIDCVTIKPFLEILGPIPNAPTRISEITRASTMPTPALERARLYTQKQCGFGRSQHGSDTGRHVRCGFRGNLLIRMSVAIIKWLHLTALPFSNIREKDALGAAVRESSRATHQCQLSR
jgi:hypothetical protein